MKHILRNILMAGIVLALVAGCGGGAKEQPAAEPPASTQPSQAPGAGQSAAPTQTTDEETSLTLDDRQSGLEQLSSYRAHWKGEWKTTKEGQTDEAKWEWTEEYTTNPPAMHFTSVSDAATDAAETMEIWRIGDASYMMNTQGGVAGECVMFTSDSEEPISESVMNPNSLGRIEDAKYIGTETVNGVRVKHYRYDEKAMSIAGATKVSGEVWVAVDGGYTVKETVTWEGQGGLLGATSEDQGQGSWTWEISDVNSVPAITPPAGCESATGDLPVLPDATEKSVFGDMISYKTATSLADAAEFYRTEMVNAGWTIEGEPELSEQFGMLTFTKEGQKAQVMLSPDNDKTSVMISIEK